jgi:hypothetical protein
VFFCAEFLDGTILFDFSSGGTPTESAIRSRPRRRETGFITTRQQQFAALKLHKFVKGKRGKAASLNFRLWGAAEHAVDDDGAGGTATLARDGTAGHAEQRASSSNGTSTSAAGARGPCSPEQTVPRISVQAWVSGFGRKGESFRQACWCVPTCALAGGRRSDGVGGKQQRSGSNGSVAFKAASAAQHDAAARGSEATPASGRGAWQSWMSRALGMARRAAVLLWRLLAFFVRRALRWRRLPPVPTRHAIPAIDRLLATEAPLGKRALIDAGAEPGGTAGSVCLLPGRETGPSVSASLPAEVFVACMSG